MEKNYNKIGNIFSVVVLAISIFVLLGFANGATSMMYFLVIANLICGPLCLILYLIEVKKGIFKTNDEEDDIQEI